MDIRCVHLIPYELDSQVYVDIQQVIPLPKAADHQVMEPAGAVTGVRFPRRTRGRYPNTVPTNPSL
jgi:hypothetical protein